MAEKYPYNAFIFTWVDNYDAQVQQLKKTMEDLDNHVQVFDHLDLENLIKAVEKLRRANFTLYNYISVIILDNKCKDARFIETSDGKVALIDSQILTIIQLNETLNEKPRLFVKQKLLDIVDLDDEDDQGYVNTCQEILSMTYYKEIYDIKNSTRYEGLTITLHAKQFSNKFHDSPFIATFCQEFGKNAEKMLFDQIYGRIKKEIKTKHNYKNIDIALESNARSKDNTRFGKGISSSILRDFFDD